VSFSQRPYAGRLPEPEAAKAAVTGYWNSVGMVDLSGSVDPRAPELERRIVLSQYLTAVNAGAKQRARAHGVQGAWWTTSDPPA
jgi:hypothetical protein